MKTWVRSSIDCTWLLRRCNREDSESVVTTQLAPLADGFTSVPVTRALPPTRRSLASKPAKRFMARILPDAAQQTVRKRLHSCTQPITSAQFRC